jgi:hypothetical protein
MASQSQTGMPTVESKAVKSSCQEITKKILELCEKGKTALAVRKREKCLRRPAEQAELQ